MKANAVYACLTGPRRHVVHELVALSASKAEMKRVRAEEMQWMSHNDRKKAGARCDARLTAVGF